MAKKTVEEIMNLTVYENKKITQLKDALPYGEYENCIFETCDFTNQNFSEFRFTNCNFTNCNLSLIKTNKTSFVNVSFKNSKMLGFRADNCNIFQLSFSFENCQLNNSIFYNCKIKSTLFKDSELQDCDFTGADLSDSIFENCNLILSIFDNTTIQRVDFRTSYNFIIDPEKNKIKKAKFSIQGALGLLKNYQIDIEK